MGNGAFEESSRQQIGFANRGNPTLTESWEKSSKEKQKNRRETPGSDSKKRDGCPVRKFYGGLFALFGEPTTGPDLWPRSL